MSEDFFDIMSNSTDRLRLKDKIVCNVAKAIKAIQQYSYSYSESGLVLSNTDWQCHKLCENLDHALLHGLRHITNGYWRVATEYTRKGTVKEIQRYNRVTTNLGRGRAWLYLALNESLLESYIRCLMENEKHIKKYYVKEALLLDQQRMNVLLTLTSGLDFVTFQLDPNVPYLDLGTSPPKPVLSSRMSQDDRVSLHSMDSYCGSPRMNGIETMVSTPDSNRLLTDSDTASLSSLDTTNGSSSTDKSRQCSLSLDSGCHLDTLGHRARPTSITPSTDTMSNTSQGETDSRLKRIESITVVDNTEELTNELEIVHVKSKNSKSKSSRKRKTSKKVLSKNTRTNSINSEENNNEEQLHGCDTDISDPNTPVSMENSITETVDCQGTPSIDSPQTPKSKSDELLEQLKKDLSQPNILENCVVKSELKLYPEQSAIVKAVEDKHLSTTDIPDIPQLLSSPVNSGVDNINVSEKPLNLETILKSNLENDRNDLAIDVQSESEVEENLYEIYGGSSNKSTENNDITSQQKQSALDDYVKFIAGEELDDDDVVDTCSFNDSQTDDLNNCDIDYPISIDNNTMLHVMLEIFKDENENFLKMLSCRQGQTEGEVVIVFVLITDKHVYLLDYKTTTKKFTIQSFVAYQDIDFIVHSINYQFVNVVCRNKRNQFWLTTGDEVLSRLIVDTMCDAVDSSELKIRKLAVFDDATTQKICLKKYITHECHCEESEATPEIYSLVYWEDPHSRQVKAEGSSKEGKLLQKVKDPYKGLIWKPVYVVLRDGIMCIFKNKSDSKPEAYLRMGGDQCVGCRRSQSSERHHSMEIVLSKGESWLLAASDNAEMCDWLMCMCRAVSEGMQNDGTPFSCLPCCTVVTNSKILMCHEDVQTSFFRTLGNANIEDVTGIILDPEDTTYCLLEFDSQDTSISSEEWALYFNSTKEREKFSTALSACWKKQFQVELPLNSFYNVTLQKRCQETSKILHNSLKL